MRLVVAGNNLMSNNMYYRLVCQQLKHSKDPYNPSGWFWCDLIDVLFRVIIGHPKTYPELYHNLDYCFPNPEKGLLDLSIYVGTFDVNPGQLLNALVTPFPKVGNRFVNMMYKDKDLTCLLDHSPSKYITRYRGTPVFQSFDGFYTADNMYLNMRAYDNYHGLNAGIIKMVMLAQHIYPLN